MPQDLLDRRTDTVIRRTVWLLPALYVLSPRLYVFGPALRLGDFLVAALLVVGIVGIVRGRRWRPGWMDWTYLALVVSIAASIAWSYLGLGVESSIRDFYEFPKFLLFWGVFALASSVRWTEVELRRITWVVVGTSLPVLLLGILQYYDLLGVNDHVTPAFASALHVAKILRNGRVTGTLENPNYLSFFLLWPLLVAYLAGMVAFMRKPASRRLATRVALLSGLVAAIIGMAASRTAFMAAGVAIAATSVATMRGSDPAERPRVRRAAGLALVVLIVSGIIGIGVVRAIPSPSNALGLFERIRIGFGEVLTPEQIEAGEGYSFRERLERWSDAVGEVGRSPLLGRGPAKMMVDELELPPTDNEYLYHAQRYGLAGLAVYLSLFVGMAIGSWRRARASETGIVDIRFGLAAAVFGLVVASMAFNVMAGTLYNLQLWPLVMFSYGVLAGTTKAKSVHDADRTRPSDG